MAYDKAMDSRKERKNFVRRNEQIRIPQVLVIHDGKNLGVMQSRDALTMARNVGLDLVEVSPFSRPPVCHITDYGKYMFDKSKKDKTKPHVIKEKEVSFKYVISEHDLDTKINQIRRFVDKGCRVKCVCIFEKREKAHKDQGFVLLNKVITALADVTTVESPPGHEGASVVCRLERKKKEPK